MDYTQFINGQFVDGTSGEPFSVICPSDETVLGEYALASPADVQAAIDAASAALPVWRQVSALKRSQFLRRVADQLRADREALARQIALELGKPLAAADQEVDVAAEMFEWAAEEARRLYGRLIPARGAGIVQSVQLEPVGVVGAFAGWNAPAITPSRKISGALAAGCTIVIKPSEETIGTALFIARAIQQAGIPDGVVNMIFGNPPEVADLLCQSDKVAMITFTGGTEIGKALGAKAVATMKRVTLELGGHGPVVVWNDVDIDEVVAKTVTAKYRNTGQICTSPTRFLIHRDIFESFAKAFAKAAGELVVGDPFAKATQVGPLKNARRRAAVEALIDNAVKHGADVLAGGKAPEGKGYFFEPTVLSVKDTSADVCRIEPFGPIAIMIPVGDLDEALTQANALRFGLAAYVFTKDMTIAHTLSQNIESGVVCVNDVQASLPETPFGGFKDSGMGSEGGEEGLREFLRTKCIRQGGLTL